jgi:serine/threonine protein phosphatase PrpC
MLACTDGLWSGLSDKDIATVAAPDSGDLGRKLKELSIKALNLNSPYSDNTTCTVLRWLSN